ncbi:protein kinase domain-containing protein [Endozoicomonas atrinae]|uniref:protein kinase domain-containing protein n=1 Tax=Endozoicomonas atrinae TaxID=1333660 RepID=UPI000825E003|nr:protein kinase [Endozoicomonas atrinae]
MPRRIKDGMEPHHFQPHPPKQPKPNKGSFGGLPVTPEVGQPYVNSKKEEVIKGNKTPLLQRNAHSNDEHQLQMAAPITFKGASIDKEYNYPIVPEKDLYKVRKLGEGAFGSVDLVVHRHTNQHLALKMVGDDAERRIECAKLIKIQRAVARAGGNTENIVNLISLSRGRSDKKYALLEYGGLDILNSIEKDGLFKDEELKRTFFQAVKGISTLFQAGYQHHDIKPENILINGKGIVKICDFGLAEKMAGNIQTGNGTPDYMPLEKVYELNNYHNDRADSWSLGCTFAEMRLGYPVMQVSDAMLKGQMLLHEAVKEIKTMREKAYQQLLQQEGEQAAELFAALTKINPKYRLSPTEALEHPYFDSCYS